MGVVGTCQLLGICFDEPMHLVLHCKLSSERTMQFNHSMNGLSDKDQAGTPALRNSLIF